MSDPRVHLVGLPDGSVTIKFPDHPAHHRDPQYVEVTFSADTLKQIRAVGLNARDLGAPMRTELPYEEET